MLSVKMSMEDWQGLLNCAMYAPAKDVLPFLNKVQTQLQTQHMPTPPTNLHRVNSRAALDDESNVG